MRSFNELYEEFKNNNEILRIGFEANEERKKRNKISLLIIAIIDAIIIYFFTKNLRFSFITIGFIMVPIVMINLIILVILTNVFSKKQSEFKSVFKEELIKKMIGNFFSNSEYFPEKSMSSKIYKEGKYESYDKYYSEDYIEAKIDEKYLIDMAEIHTKREETDRDSDGNTTTRTYTVFHGIFSKIIMEKSINSTLRITSNYSIYENRLEMDSSEFEKEFNVFASNKIIGMQILTADIMEELLEFKNKVKENFDIFINEDKMYLRFHCGSIFEPNLLKNKILDEKSLNMYYNILEFIYELSKKIVNIVEETEI